MYSCKEKERGNDYCEGKGLSNRGQSEVAVSSYLVLPVILLGMTQHSVAKPANMSERSVALVSKLLQSQHGTITTVCERGLEKFENLKWKWGILIPENVINHKL